MIRLAYDLHIHSCLSPCASNDMTPNNIVLMAKLKGLDMIAVTDHNHTANLKAVSKAAEEHGILFIPGIELETSEEIHLLCYFPSFVAVEQMQNLLNQHYQLIPNKEEIFGEQWILNEEDQPVEKVEHLLSISTTLDLYQAVSVVRDLGGIIIPAHVDRESYSILSNLGAVPEDLNFRTLELSRYAVRNDFFSKYPDFYRKRIITSSDAHDLGMIFERESFIELEEPTLECLLTILHPCG